MQTGKLDPIKTSKTSLDGNGATDDPKEEQPLDDSGARFLTPNDLALVDNLIFQLRVNQAFRSISSNKAASVFYVFGGFFLIMSFLLSYLAGQAYFEDSTAYIDGNRNFNNKYFGSGADPSLKSTIYSMHYSDMGEYARFLFSEQWENCTGIYCNPQIDLDCIVELEPPVSPPESTDYCASKIKGGTTMHLWNREGNNPCLDAALSRIGNDTFLVNTVCIVDTLMPKLIVAVPKFEGTPAERDETIKLDGENSHKMSPLVKYFKSCWKLTQDNSSIAYTMPIVINSLIVGASLFGAGIVSFCLAALIKKDHLGMLSEIKKSKKTEIDNLVRQLEDALVKYPDDKDVMQGLMLARLIQSEIDKPNAPYALPDIGELREHSVGLKIAAEKVRAKSQREQSVEPSSLISFSQFARPARNASTREERQVRGLRSV